MSHLDETIVALAAAPGPGARTVVRLSGPRAADIVGSLFDPMPTGRGMAQGSFQLPGVHSSLPGEVLYMPGPRSYTGQDCVEIHTISSPPLADHLVASLLDAGARAARAGEFTMRAFLSGKRDLPRAEAILAVIEADSDEELRQALEQLAGGVTQPLFGLRDDLLNLLADVEAGLDFSNEDIEFVDRTDLLLRLGGGLAHLTNLRKQFDDRSLSHRPFRVALAGEPNAGKSRLFNALAGIPAAIVSPRPGTTRDYVTRSVTLQGTNIELIDTAGLRDTDDAIEAQAQRLGREQSARADLVLWCVSTESLEQRTERPGEFSSATLVWTKCDLRSAPEDDLGTSARTGAGIPALRRYLLERAREHRAPALAPSLARCRHHVERGLIHLRNAHHAVLFQEPPEILASELRLALDELGTIVGAIHTDDLLDRVFSRFCIGK